MKPLRGTVRRPAACRASSATLIWHSRCWPPEFCRRVPTSWNLSCDERGSNPQEAELEVVEHPSRKHDACKRIASGDFARPIRARGDGRRLLPDRISTRASRTQRLRASLRAYDVPGLGARGENGTH